VTNRKIQLPVIGGVRKTIRLPAGAGTSGTTIAEFGNGQITLAQLKAALGVSSTPNTVAPGTLPAPTLIAGNGLSGGGQLVGPVGIELAAPIPFFIRGGAGERGRAGPPGVQGINGAPGMQGTSGPRGMRGEKGDRGLVGPQGPIGPQGPQGPSGGGGGSSQWNNTPDTHVSPPASGFVADDEFEGTTLDTAGTRYTGALAWTERHFSGSAAITLGQGAATFTSDTSISGVNYHLVTQPIAAGLAWRYRWKFLVNATSNYNEISAILYESGTDRILAFGILVNPGPAATNTYFWVSWYSNYQTFTNYDAGSLTVVPPNLFDPVKGAPNTLPFYLEIEGYDSGGSTQAVRMRWSATGYDNDFKLFVNLGNVSPTFFTTVPDTIGIGVNGQNGTYAAIMICDWFRRMA